MDARVVFTWAEATLYDLQRQATGANVHRLNNRATIIRGMQSMATTQKEFDDLEKVIRHTQSNCLAGKCPCARYCNLAK